MLREELYRQEMARQDKAWQERMIAPTVEGDGSGRARSLEEDSVVGNIAKAVVSFLAKILGRMEQN